MSAAETLSARRIVGVLRLAAGGLVLSAIITQIVDQLGAGVFVPSEYFSYFTVESSMMNVVVLVVGGVLALRLPRDTPLYTGVRAAVVTYAVVTALVYNGLLRGLPATGYVGIQWPNEVEHVWIPIYIFIDWLFATGRARLAWSWVWPIIGYPLAWCGYTLIHGALSGWYPYPFINPTGPGGWPSVIGYIVGIASLIVVLGSLAIRYSRWRESPAASLPAREPIDD
jgi:hypothetical protein